MRKLRPEESELLDYLLNLTSHPNTQKSALQRLCELLEEDVYFSNAARFRTTVLGLLWAKDVLVRRWATKAITLLGLGTSTNKDVLFVRLQTEPDFENRAWVISAIGALLSMTNVYDICARANIDYLKEYELAARLFSEERFDSLGAQFVNIETDPELALLWLSLLEGYQKAPTQAAHQFLPNYEVIRQLNLHHDSKVAEYSIWSLWNHPIRTFEDLMLGEQDYTAQAAGIRRWIYRLYTKCPTYIASRPDLLESFFTDSERTAREGLALGMRSVREAGVRDGVDKWFCQEEDDAISDLLYEHMALNSEDASKFHMYVTDRFKSETKGGPFRNRVFAAASGTELFHDLKRIELEEDTKKHKEQAKPPPQLLFPPQSAGPIMINNYGNIGNLTLCDQKINSEKFQQRFSDSGLETEELKLILDLAKEKLGKIEADEFAKNVSEITEDGSAEAALTLKEILNKLSGTVTAGGKLASAMEKFAGILDGMTG